MSTESNPVDPAMSAAALWRAQLGSGWAWLEAWLQVWRSLGGKPPLELRAAVDEMTKEPSLPV